jgi:hypothetical protein
MFDAYDAYLAMQQKQAADALVPGQVGMGPTPGVTGMLDSDGGAAENSAIANQRAAIQEAALIQGNADAGAGYSTPPAAQSPSLQMENDVKAAFVIDHAINMAEDMYLDWKLSKVAATDEQKAHAKAVMKANLAGPERSYGAHNRGTAPTGYQQVQSAMESAHANAFPNQNAGRPAVLGNGPQQLEGLERLAATMGPDHGPNLAQRAGAALAGLPAKAWSAINHNTATRAGAAGVAALGAAGAGYAAAQSQKAASFNGYTLQSPLKQTLGRRAMGIVDGATQTVQNIASNVSLPQVAGAAMLAGGGAAAGYAAAQNTDLDKAASVLGQARDMAVAGYGRARQAAGSAYGTAAEFVNDHQFAAGAAAGVGAGVAGQMAAQAAAQQMGLARPQNPSLAAQKEASLAYAENAGIEFALAYLNGQVKL